MEWLFKNRRREDGREYSYSEVARATGLTRSYIWKMRFGQISNPGRDALAALSRFFGVRGDFWFTDLVGDLPEEALLLNPKQDERRKTNPEPQ